VHFDALLADVDATCLIATRHMFVIDPGWDRPFAHREKARRLRHTLGLAPANEYPLFRRFFRRYSRVWKPRRDVYIVPPDPNRPLPTPQSD
jgi:hypothetical protein